MTRGNITFQTPEDITHILEADSWRMDVLKAAEGLNLLDWWIGAGFLRNAIWNAVQGIDSPPTRDVDLVYFNKDNVNPGTAGITTRG